VSSARPGKRRLNYIASDLCPQSLGVSSSRDFVRAGGRSEAGRIPREISSGEAEPEMTRRPEHGQYNDFLHAGVIAALIDTCCGFAAATLLDRFLASHFSVNCLSPAAGNKFLAKGRVIKHGRKQIFARGELFVIDEPNAKLVATGDTILVSLDGATTSS
jgi:uncharacterized protein (TIGR00369 family)